jgi:hypothetical protein
MLTVFTATSTISLASGGARRTWSKLRFGSIFQVRVECKALHFDDAVEADARAHGKGQTAEDELEMRNLQPLRCQGNLAAGSEASRAEMDA